MFFAGLNLRPCEPPLTTQIGLDTVLLAGVYAIYMKWLGWAYMKWLATIVGSITSWAIHQPYDQPYDQHNANATHQPDDQYCDQHVDQRWLNVWVDAWWWTHLIKKYLTHMFNDHSMLLHSIFSIKNINILLMRNLWISINIFSSFVLKNIQ